MAPQCSVLGPLLCFTLVYINDRSDVVINKLLLYADDSEILVSGKNKQDIEKLLTEDLNCLSQWLIIIDNKLSLHLGKIESILFGSPQKIKCNPSLEMTCNNLAIINSTTSVKYLGASLYQTLSFSKLAQSLLKKVNARLKCLYRNSSTLLNTLNTFSYVVNSMPLRLCLLYLVQRFEQGLEKQTSNYSE